MGTRIKTFDSTGVAPGGKLYAGDLNSIQDDYADLLNYSQTIGLGTLAVGEAGLQLLRYGSLEARLTGAFRTDGILRGLGGLFAGTFTTTQRNAIASGSRPYGLVIFNSTTNALEVNVGSDATPNWQTMKFDVAERFVIKNADTSRNSTTSRTNDPELSLAVVASETVVISGELWVIGQDAAPDFSFELIAPSGSTGKWGIDGPSISETGGSSSGVNMRVDAWAINNGFGLDRGSLSDTGICRYELSALLQIGGTAGSVTMKWAQRSSSPFSITVCRHSWMRAQKMM